MELLRSRLRFIFPIDGERKKGPACSTTVTAYTRARARALVILGACMHACMHRTHTRAHASFCFACRSRPRAIGYGNAFDPIFPPENVQRYRRGCRRASRPKTDFPLLLKVLISPLYNFAIFPSSPLFLLLLFSTPRFSRCFRFTSGSFASAGQLTRFIRSRGSSGCNGIHLDAATAFNHHRTSRSSPILASDATSEGTKARIPVRLVRSRGTSHHTRALTCIRRGCHGTYICRSPWLIAAFDRGWKNKKEESSAAESRRGEIAMRVGTPCTAASMRDGEKRRMIR